MSMPDKYLMRKIKKREEVKLKLLKESQSRKALEDKAQKKTEETEEEHQINVQDGSKHRKAQEETSKVKKKAKNNEQDEQKEETVGPVDEAEQSNSDAEETAKDRVTSNQDKAQKITEETKEESQIHVPGGSKRRKTQDDTSKKKKIRKNKTEEDEQKSTANELDERKEETVEPEDKAEQSKSDAEETAQNSVTSNLPAASMGSGAAEDTSFKVLEGRISGNLLKAIEEMGFTHMTEIQAKTIPALLDCKNVVAASKTGSGKTLAFLIPAIDLIQKLGFKPRNGTGCIIICPTRELCIQTFGVLHGLMKYQRQTYGLLMGGACRKTEAKKLENGVNIIVATPGRLLDHLQNTADFVYKCAMCLIIDEVDRIMDFGLGEELKQIVKILPTYRQTVLFSATHSKRTELLMKTVFKTGALYLGLNDNNMNIEGLAHGYLLCPTDKKFLFLFTFLKNHMRKKVMVFFSSCASVKFHYHLFNYIDLPVMSIHGKMKHSQRTKAFFQFCNAKSGALLCTDVAARGLDFPAVDWIIQYDPPLVAKEYVHRVGGTARGEGSRGQAALILRREELGFLWYLHHHRIPVNELGFKWELISKGAQLDLEQLVARNDYLNMLAKQAFRNYVKAYDAHRVKLVFNIETLDLAQVAKSFGFTVPPAINLNVGRSKDSQPRKCPGRGGYRQFKTLDNPGMAKQLQRSKTFR